MIKIFFYGNCESNDGPSNVNRYILNAATDKLYYRKGSNKILKALDTVKKLFLCDVTVFSGFNQRAKTIIRLLKICKKKSIYYMHGCVSYENEINKLGIKKKIIDSEIALLHRVDVVLCVSEQYMKWVKKRYPEFCEKIHYINSGFDNIDILSVHNKQSYKKRGQYVATAGADRAQKNNVKVSEAIELLNQRTELSLTHNVYGRQYHQEKNIFETYPNTYYKGQLSYEQFMEELDNTKVFVVNSIVESFGLSVLDALKCGCSVLISSNTGIQSILDLEDDDIIFDVEDSNEIANKIEKLLHTSNNERILKGMDFKYFSWEKVAERLCDICELVCRNEDYTLIK